MAKTVSLQGLAYFLLLCPSFLTFSSFDREENKPDVIRATDSEHEIVKEQLTTV